MDPHVTKIPGLERVRLLLMDVDGVLTDGRIYYGGDGIDIKAFHTQDGLGLRLLQMEGIRLGIVTGRSSEAVRRRAAELGIDIVHQGIRDKAALVSQLVEATGIPAEEMAFVGDDLLDLPIMARVGVPMAVANAVEEVKRAAAAVTRAPGGKGAVREIAEAILKAQDRWERLVGTFR